MCVVLFLVTSWLVIVISDDYQANVKVVRYSGSTEKQCIQLNDNGEHLFSNGYFVQYIRDNRNLDISVSDVEAGAVMVVDQTGKLRCTYTGPLSSRTNGLFNPRDITTDIQGRILTVDRNNCCIYIIDQDGQFFRYIDNCHLQGPLGICVDTNGHLIVTENKTGKVKKFQYYK